MVMTSILFFVLVDYVVVFNCESDCTLEFTDKGGVAKQNSKDIKSTDSILCTQLPSRE